MFDLEKSIAGWRKQMQAAGLKTPALLEELENHLREEVGQQMESGLNAQQAFEAGERVVGEASELKREFKRAGDPIEMRLVKLTIVACVVIACLFSLEAVLLLFSNNISLMARMFGLAAVATTVLGWKYNHKFLPVIRRGWIRTVIGGTCCLAGIILMGIYCDCFLSDLLIQAVRTETFRGWFLLTFLCLWCMVALLGSVCFGLEKAAKRENTLPAS